MQQDDLIGITLGNYRILETLGQGGMARVYKAYQESLDREVAVKVLPPWFAADRNFIERFNLEAKLVARLAHPNIVTVHDANEYNGHLYIVMQLVDGGTLKHRLDQAHNEGKAIPMSEVTAIFTQLASALSYAHEQGIVHRDIKPVNVLMDRAGRPILSDFGIAKVLASTEGQLTRPGAGVGTPEYMSPEQCQGTAVDARADIYALGVMLFESVTGRTPFVGATYPALAHSHIYETPPRPSLFNPSITPAVEQVIARALMKLPQQRFQSASDMAEALRQATTLPPAQVPASNYYRGPQQQPPMPYPGLPQQSPQSGQLISPMSPASMSQAAVMYACVNCRHPNRPAMKFCTRCGYAMNKCSNCGRDNPVSNRFCIFCGKPTGR